MADAIPSQVCSRCHTALEQTSSVTCSYYRDPQHTGTETYCLACFVAITCPRKDQDSCAILADLWTDSMVQP